MSSILTRPSKSRNRLISGFLRLSVLSLLTAAFSGASLHAQSVAYVVNSGSNNVSVIDTASNSVTATITVGTGPEGVVFSPDGTRAYVTNFGNGTISVIDTAANAATAPINVGGGPLFPAITPDGKNLYVPDFSNGKVLVVSTVSNTLTTTIPVSSGPSAVAITPNGTRAYVLSFGAVSVIDTATNTVVGSPVMITSSSQENKTFTISNTEALRKTQSKNFDHGAAEPQPKTSPLMTLMKQITTDLLLVKLHHRRDR